MSDGIGKSESGNSDFELADFGSSATGNSSANAGGSLIDFGNITIDPAAVSRGDAGSDTGNGGGDPGAPKRRGRKPGSGAGARKKAPPVSVDILSGTLHGIHSMLAAMLHIPELAIREDEAKTLAEAASAVSKYYDIGMSEKAMAWGNLGMCAALVYGPRLFAMASAKKDHPPRPAPATVKASAPRSENVVPIQGAGLVDVSAGMPPGSF